MATPPAPDDWLVRIPTESLRRLDLSPLEPWRQRSPAELLAGTGQLRLAYDWPRPDDDPRELSEIPELRLWSLRADALCPWLTLLLDRRDGDLIRHVAMLLPHGFSRNEGLRFAPESLDLWITHRLFLLDDWAGAAGLHCRQSLSQMAAVLGFELDPGFWQSLPSPRGENNEI
ncbi:CRR6 family NdhI maturation factor [Synechococcus sp. CS-1328]|uniref:CRR6 family NdhI maturation factor n=1 Tax=Synechococcus sp. CS-1328 TaxID=2847976 RepID=UPI00223B32F8|nr:CRR6 family NdhI maturation factor [Synechococcus sp. CS-1328]MCT0225179.1 CRR6 family NdhI maturation factor [Synechococcus sp. CS-1328]